MTDFIYDGERLIQVSQIEAVEPYVRESVKSPEAYGDHPEVTEVEARIVHMISGHSYTSDGSFLEIVDLLMHLDGAEQIT